MKFRLDFGRIFPGILLLISGLVLFVALVLIAVVAFLFSFILGPGALGFTLELMLVPAVLIAVGVVTVLTGVSWWGKDGKGWLSGIARTRALEDRIRISGRVGEVIGIVISAIILLFLYGNQLRGVAFFTSSFGSLAQLFFYAPLFLGMALSLARAVYGRRNEIRPFDSLHALFLAVAAFWLLSVFPFEFAHLGDMFPAPIQFLFGWLSNDIGRALFTLAGVASIANFVYTMFLYSSVRGQLIMMRAKPL